jgi:acetaldehyde dehydrogenase (acetylating)
LATKSIDEARALAAGAREAQRALAAFSQEEVDRVVDAMALAARQDAERLARLAHEETGFGNVPDKTRKNLFSATTVHAYIRPLRTVGVLREDRTSRVVEIAEPMGVVAAVIPSTNPTSTAIFKALVGIKARDAVVLSPHPSARACILETARVLIRAGEAAGLPRGALSCLTEVSLEGTQELMRCRDTSVILATGGIGLVRAAYSSGKPAYGVGPGNVPAYIERTADVPKAVRDVINGKTFDYGTLCSSEQALVCDEAIREEVEKEVRANGGYFLSPQEAAAVAKIAVTEQRLANPEIVGRPATVIAQRAGLSVPAETRALVAPLAGVGRDFPLSIEKLSPILAFYVVRDAREGSARCLELLRFGGLGHTAGIHSRDEQVIREFALRKPVFRVIANSQTSMGATGFTTGLAPSMSLGCGAPAGNITSDNITPLHLINVKRLAFGLRSAGRSGGGAAGPALDFVAEADVRRALTEGRRLRLAAKAIVTPSARDLADGKDVFES